MDTYTVIVTGGGSKIDWGLKKEIPVASKRVDSYSMQVKFGTNFTKFCSKYFSIFKGLSEVLPDMIRPRKFHGCGHFQKEGKKVG